MFVGVSKEAQQVSLAWRRKEFYLVGLGVEGNYVCCHGFHIYGTGGAKRWGEIFPIHHLDWKVTMGRPVFMGGCHYIILIFWNFCVLLENMKAFIEKFFSLY